MNNNVCVCDFGQGGGVHRMDITTDNPVPLNTSLGQNSSEVIRLDSIWG